MNLSMCSNWLCAKTDKEKASTPSGECHPAAVVTSGPGPSPGSSNSCDDVVPPPKNCYRLVMLGKHTPARPGKYSEISLLSGSARVGKTNLVSRFLGGKFEESYTPTIEDFHRKLYRIRGEIHQLDILDTSGNHPFPAMRRLSFLTGE